MTIRNIHILDHQRRLVLAESPVAAIVGGVGSGKSQALGYCLMRWIQEESPSSAVLAGAPTHEQLDKSTLARIKYILTSCDVDFVHGCMPPDSWNVPLMKEFRRWTNILTVETGHIIYGVSLDDPDNIRGPQYGLALLDELAFVDEPDAFEVILGRMRCRNTQHHRVRVATSPNGMNWFYEYFIDPQKRRQSYEVIQATTFDNLYNPKNYIDMLSGYDAERYQQEVLGQFVSGGFGRVYTEFKQNVHVQPCGYDSEHPVFIGADFNRSPMCWVLSQYDEEHDVFRQFEELVIIEEATTHQACEMVASKYVPRYTTVYPDASCRARSTNAIGAESDLEVIQSYGFDVVVGSSNPFVRDRIEAVQERFRRGGYLLDPGCAATIQSLNRTNYMPGTRMVKKSKKPKAIGEHPTDAIGYLVYAFDKAADVEPVAWMS